MDRNSRSSIFVPVLVALITGALAGIPALLSFINTPRQIEAELSKVRQQSEMQIKLQRDQEVATILARLDAPTVDARAGAALSLAVLGGEEVVPILVGKLRESSMELASLEISGEEGVRSDRIREEKRFINAVKQSLLTIGLPALSPLVELNRELKFTAWHLPRSRAAHDAETEEEQVDLQKEIDAHTRANDEVKDVIRSLLIKVSSVEGSEAQSVSPIAQQKISLAEIDLSYTVLIRINLAGVDLTNADLRDTRIAGVDFRNADLKGALLDDAGLGETNFEGADFEGASLVGAFNYDQAKFKGANFSSAKIDNALKDYLRKNGALNVP